MMGYSKNEVSKNSAYLKEYGRRGRGHFVLAPFYLWDFGVLGQRHERDGQILLGPQINWNLEIDIDPGMQLYLGR